MYILHIKYVYILYIYIRLHDIYNKYMCRYIKTICGYIYIYIYIYIYKIRKYQITEKNSSALVYDLKLHAIMQSSSTMIILRSSVGDCLLV